MTGRRYASRRLAVLVAVLVTAAGLAVGCAPGGGTGALAERPAGDRGPGPWSTVEGMPAGFERSEAGARAAGVALAATVEEQMMYLDAPAAARGQEQVAAAGSAERLAAQRREQMDQWRAALGPGSGQLWWVVAPLAASVRGYTPESAEVDVWVMVVLSRTGLDGPRAWFGTSTVQLVWERDDWRIASQRVADGPSPQLGPSARPDTAEDLARRLDGFELIGASR